MLHAENDLCTGSAGEYGEVANHLVADLGGGGGGGTPLCFFITLFSSLLTCCRYVATRTPGLASSARNIVRCLKPNGLGTRPRSSIPLCVPTYYVRERNLSKEEAHGGPETCNPRTNLQCKVQRCHESPS